MGTIHTLSEWLRARDIKELWELVFEGDPTIDRDEYGSWVDSMHEPLEQDICRLYDPDPDGNSYMTISLFSSTLVGICFGHLPHTRGEMVWYRTHRSVERPNFWKQ